MNKAVAVLWVLVLVLAACGQPADGVPVVRAQPGTNNEIQTLQVELKAEVNNETGRLKFTSPRGLRTAYLFEGGNVRMRTDIPGSFFPDQKPRILLSDQNKKTARVLFSDSKKADAAINSDALGTMFENPTGLGFGFFDSKSPFKKLNADQFAALMRTKAFDVSEKTPERMVANRNFSYENVTRLLTLTFDVAEGAVTEVADTVSTPQIKYISKSKIHYTDVQGIPDTKVPYKIEAQVESELQGAARVEKVTYPTARKRLTKNQPLNLKPGEYVAQTFTAPPGEGVVDTNRQTMKQTIEYKNIKLNELTPDYFSVGGF